MFWHVWHRASQCENIVSVTLATDDERIAKAATELSVPFVMTAATHPSGTDRVHEAATLLQLHEDAIIINVQGDEPALPPQCLHQLIGLFEDAHVGVATLARHLPVKEASSSDIVKVVCAHNGDALYFSRAQIPHDRNKDEVQGDFLAHVGIYAFRMQTLAKFVSLPPSQLELREKLEQLRLLENNIPIRVALTEHVSPGVDRPEDIAAVLPFLSPS